MFNCWLINIREANQGRYCCKHRNWTSRSNCRRLIGSNFRIRCEGFCKLGDVVRIRMLIYYSWCTGYDAGRWIYMNHFVCTAWSPYSSHCRQITATDSDWTVNKRFSYVIGWLLVHAWSSQPRAYGSTSFSSNLPLSKWRQWRHILFSFDVRFDVVYGGHGKQTSSTGSQNIENSRYKGIY